VVEDCEGREVAVVHLYGDGTFVLGTGPEAPVSAVVHATNDGGLGVGVNRKGQDAQLMIRSRPDGASDFEVQDRRYFGRVLEHVDITAEGKPLRRPVGP
jgi:hypothetical protein